MSPTKQHIVHLSGDINPLQLSSTDRRFWAVSWGTKPAPAMYQAMLGARRTFLSLGDAQAYDRGVLSFPAPCLALAGTPYAEGWADARDSAGAAAMDDMAAWPQKQASECGVHR